jgi:hypothetical protein
MPSSAQMSSYSSRAPHRRRTGIALPPSLLPITQASYHAQSPCGQPRETALRLTEHGILVHVHGLECVQQLWIRRPVPRQATERPEAAGGHPTRPDKDVTHETAVYLCAQLGTGGAEGQEGGVRGVGDDRVHEVGVEASVDDDRG